LGDNNNHNASPGSNEALPRILIVEDNETFRDTVVEVLRDVGYKVKGARSLDKAAKRLNKHKFDLVLSDIHIGDHTGFEVLQVAHEKRPTAKIVMMSTNADPELVQQALDSGAARFLPKPFRVKELLKMIEELLSRAESDPPEPPTDTQTTDPNKE
jgi:DNA-binding response OmpR family regulator